MFCNSRNPWFILFMRNESKKHVTVFCVCCYFICSFVFSLKLVDDNDNGSDKEDNGNQQVRFYHRMYLVFYDLSTVSEKHSFICSGRHLVEQLGKAYCFNKVMPRLSIGIFTYFVIGIAFVIENILTKNDKTNKQE